MASGERDRLLVEPAWLEEHLHDPRLRIVDMRGYVRTVECGAGEQEAVYEGARTEYEQGHIPGAIYLDWTSDIVDPDSEVKAQVAPPERFAEVLGRLGIGDEHIVVAYDAHPASQFATRLWWALTYYGHREVRVLNGGFPRWLREGRPVTMEIPRFPPALFTPRVQPELRATAEEVLAVLGREGVRVIDARDVGQYSGQVVRRPGRRGHIPGAINIPREELVDPHTGQFRSNEELAEVFARVGVRPEERVIAYCNGGVAATVVLFSLALLGYPHLTNYDGSWNEWGVRPDLPTEV
ncbi:sulfurtransferase [Thermogemmatispora sp.]|uniref:sulfurtransferase n=1 Tax=Thermogemmatispora sp. TaxID=1968838 RepID=UPI001D763386|nr:sulfurtransferase [Thermogemmatispora sp.]MBX5448457.1 sulfurtransferase [Thermogemmatispora sp.]